MSLGKTLAERVSGLVMAGFDGVEAANVQATLPAGLAGSILFQRNLVNPAQVSALTEALASFQTEDGLLPLLAIDQEGGTVSRLSSFGTTTPSAMALGAIGDEGTTQSIYQIIGTELCALGVNLNFAPVADVNNNPGNPVIGVRSFGSDPAMVARHVVAAIKGLHSSGLGATAKHFPGHGDTTVDSHHDLPVITHDLNRMRRVELVPFAAAIANGVDAIMTAHVLFSGAATDGLPATLSRAVLTELLRNELGFEGVICTDCMEMDAIADSYGPERAAVLAVAAGADLVMFSHTAAKVRAAISGLQKALADGDISQDQVETSLQRVKKLRARLTAQKKADRNLATVGSKEHKQIALDAARRAIVAIRDPQKLLPLHIEPGQRAFVVQFTAGTLTPVEDAQSKQATAIGRLLASKGARVHEQTRTLDPSGHEYKQLLMASGSSDVVITVTSRAQLHPLQLRAVSDLALLGKRVIAIAAREPYDARVLPQDMTVIASFGDDANALRAAGEAMLGEFSPAGKLPVRLDPPAAVGAAEGSG